MLVKSNAALMMTMIGCPHSISGQTLRINRDDDDLQVGGLRGTCRLLHRSRMPALLLLHAAELDGEGLHLKLLLRQRLHGPDEHDHAIAKRGLASNEVVKDLRDLLHPLHVDLSLGQHSRRVLRVSAFAMINLVSEQ